MNILMKNHYKGKSNKIKPEFERYEFDEEVLRFYGRTKHVEGVVLEVVGEGITLRSTLKLSQVSL